MACSHPLTVTVGIDKFRVPCRQCMPCRVAYQSSLIFAASNELYYNYRRGYGASFCTFTYDDRNIPPLGSLRKRDLQLFMKRTRSSISYKDVALRRFKFVACGEYGDKFARPHYHVIFIGLSDYEARMYARSCWNKGLIDIGPLKPGGLRYVLKYCTKQLRGSKAVELYDDNGLERPFLSRSVRLGYEWLRDNATDLTDRNFQYIRDGKLVPLPKYYRDLLDKSKEYDKLPSMMAIKATADSLGMSTYDYQVWHGRHVEKMLIDAARASGTPVDDSDFIADTPSGVNFGRMAEDIIDPIPF